MKLSTDSSSSAPVFHAPEVSFLEAMNADRDQFNPDLPPRPESALTLPDEFTGLFDSRRSYLEQLPFYKAATSNPTND